MHASVAAISSPHAVTMLRTDYHYITASALPHLSCLADAEQPGGWFIAAWEGKKLAFFLFLAARTGFHSVQCASLFFFFCLSTGCCISCACTSTWLMYPIRIRSACSANHPPHTRPHFSQCTVFFSSTFFFFTISFTTHRAPILTTNKKPWSLSPAQQSTRAFSLSGA